MVSKYTPYHTTDGGKSMAHIENNDADIFSEHAFVAHLYHKSEDFF